jgi:hypothetical protein
VKFEDNRKLEKQNRLVDLLLEIGGGGDSGNVVVVVMMMMVMKEAEIAMVPDCRNIGCSTRE